MREMTVSPALLGLALAVCLPFVAAASPPSVTDVAGQAASAPVSPVVVPMPAGPAAATVPVGAPAATAGPPSGVAAPDATAASPPADATGAKTHVHAAPARPHRRVAAARTHAAAPSTDATVALTTQPGSALETTATRLVSSDLKQSRRAGAPPVMLVGSARLSVAPGSAALFVQVQSADFCGSAGCSTSAYLKHGDDWTKVLDSISGPIKVSRKSHKGMYDLLVHGKDRWVWTGSAYADTLPSPEVDLLHSVKR